MIRLSSSRKLQAYMSASASTQPTATVSFYDVPNGSKPDFSEYRGATQITPLNSTTPVDICDSPPETGTVRNVDYVAINCPDSAGGVVNVRLYSTGGTAVQASMAVLTTESVIWTPQSGWQVVT